MLTEASAGPEALPDEVREHFAQRHQELYGTLTEILRQAVPADRRPAGAHAHDRGPAPVGGAAGGRRGAAGDAPPRAPPLGLAVAGV